MLQVITAKLKLEASSEQKELLREVSLAYRDALNYTSQVNFDNGKSSNGTRIQKLVYRDLRAEFNLPSQMACNVPRQIGATYKGLLTKLKQNEEAIRTGKTLDRFKGLDEAPKFVSRTCNLNYLRDFTFKPNQQVSVITLQGRITVNYFGYNKHIQLIKSGCKIGGAKIYYSKSSKTYYLLVSLELELSELEPVNYRRVVGVDVGRRFLAVTTDVQNQTQFFSGSETIHKANQYQRARKTLQRKGTRSATRRLKLVSGRERRFTADVNHKISKRIVTPCTLFGLEDLTHIRDRTKPKKKGKKASTKQRKANRKQAKWSFAELHTFIDYKAVFIRSLAIKVDANYTSIGCPKCGHVSNNNRPNKGLIFRCECCNFELHADLVGARNITLRTLLSRQDWERTGVLSVRPDASNGEASSERLLRYSELRWSSDTSPRYSEA
ncbi:IS200/IS605 family element transposase accessory protein TnpB [Chroococcidiopsis sp. FACHB-1243]|uniref:RNA-guided endonuclease InsQ/TnpB family protein n=1 Tax=Chroococcidiopsis sp. [FACHB-1243] TaxID=2692781 RepID=UPI00177F9844|nr:RNA-guided endonuclease TnpB family protein [Chroococcidiopsis sp. [FACHB-1243]]MBD2304877.1 IS200/IS605 family element transposase accessory protein TnpB [Chroococcidiopsis sp. [FACHB-1243]]